jgi:hypothetical protein
MQRKHLNTGQGQLQDTTRAHTYINEAQAPAVCPQKLVGLGLVAPVPTNRATSPNKTSLPLLR